MTTEIKNKFVQYLLDNDAEMITIDVNTVGKELEIEPRFVKMTIEDLAKKDLIKHWPTKMDDSMSLKASFYDFAKNGGFK
ncbi:MAG: hypothetical protein KL787_09955 [Taibaiella sp.]|nr:hypothetical protein [Taibaiella sp.]